jgi:hypothetical protein
MSGPHGDLPILRSLCYQRGGERESIPILRPYGRHLRTMDVHLVALLLCLWAATPALALLGISRPLTGGNSQQPLLPENPNPASNYSVGFSLASSYGAAAVIIDTPNEEKKTLTWVAYGEESYQSVMKRLSLESSRHLAYISRIHFYPEESY